MVIKHSTVHNPNEIVPSADWNADHTGTATAEPHTHTHASTTGQTTDDHHAKQHALNSAADHTGSITDAQHGVRTTANAHAHSHLSGIGANDHHPQSHTLASHSTKAHAELTNVTSDQHHAQSHTLASHSTKAHAELTNVTANQHHAQSHNMASHTDDYSAGEGIDISVGNVISGEDATTANKGIASFNTFDFSVAAGAVSLDDDIISTIGGDAGTATGLGHNINILGGEGIDTAGLADDITISGEDATTANKGIAKFNTLNFSVAGGAVSLGAQGVALNMGTHKINNVVDPALDQDAATKKYVDDNITAITSYATGWINRSDWTNVHLGSNTTKNVDSNVTHNLNANLAQLIFKVLVSTDGTDANSFDVSYTGPENGIERVGITIHYVDANNIKVQTATYGIRYVPDAGTPVTIDDENWHYKIKVWKLG